MGTVKLNRDFGGEMAEYDVLSFSLSPLSADFVFLLKALIIGQNPPFEFGGY